MIPRRAENYCSLLYRYADKPYEEFEHKGNIFENTPGLIAYNVHIGEQWKFKFSNGYGASVIFAPAPFSKSAYEGLLELAVLKYDEDGHSEICYDTEISDDVLINLTEENVLEILKKIEKIA